MSTQAVYYQNLITQAQNVQLALNGLVTANTASGNMVSASSVTAIQTALTTVQTAINAITPQFLGNN